MTRDAEDDAPERLLRFLLRFDRCEYWLSHEELEELWLEERRDLYKGLIQVAAAFVHIDRENWRGARTKLEQALGYLRDGPDSHRGLDLAAVRRRAEALLEHVRELAAGSAREFDEARRFVLAPLYADSLADVELPEAELPYRVRRHREGYRIGRDPHRRD